MPELPDQGPNDDEGVEMEGFAMRTCDVQSAGGRSGATRAATSQGRACRRADERLFRDDITPA